MTIGTRDISYRHDVDLEGVLTFEKGWTTRRPAVLVLHGMEGRSALQIDFAKKLAEWGHVGFAADLYGKDIGGANSDESERRMLAFMQNRPMLQDRLLHTIQVVRGLEEVDSSRTAAVGFCFGGLCALDVARTGIDLREVASFHGVLSPPGNAVGNKIKAR